MWRARSHGLTLLSWAFLTSRGIYQLGAAAPLMVLARTGYKRDFFMVGQWFPKVGVWWHDAWNCHQFHATTEFFADFGTYDVRLTVPQNYVLGSSGDEVASFNKSDGTK